MLIRKLSLQAFATLTAMVAASASVHAEATKGTSEWTTFKENDGRVSFSYPKDWVEFKSKTEGGKPGDVVVILHAPDDKQNCNLLASPPVHNMTVHQYQDSLDKYAPWPAGTKATKVSDRFVKVDGQEMYERVSKSKSADGQDIAQFSFGIIKDRLYQIVLTCHYDKLQENSALFEKIGESLRVKN